MSDLAGLGLAVAQVIASLIEVAKDTKNAAQDIRDLRRELLAGLYTLKSSLEYLSHESTERLEHLGWRQYAYDEMISMLEQDVSHHPSKLKRTKQYGTWHWKKEKVQEHLERVERIKSWFVLATTSDIGSSVDSISQSLRSLEANAEKDRDMRAHEIEQTSRARLLQYLAPLDPERAHELALSRHQSGTSTWFLDGPLREFLDTTQSKSRIMWLKGKSGSGKSTLLAQTVNHLQIQHQDLNVIYWYCTFDNSESQRPEIFLGWILAKMGYKIPGLLDPLISQMKDAEKEGSKPRFREDKLEKTLLDNHAAVPTTVIALDAINESEMQTDMAILIHRIAQRLSNVRIIVSSTGSPPVSISQDDMPHLVEMSHEHLRKDIDVFIAYMLDNELPFTKLDGSLRNEIHDAVLSRADGMFRYAHCQMGLLKGKSTPRHIRRALSDMPSDLDEIYAAILKGIRQDRDVFKEALRWLCYSQRPLGLEELAELVIIEDGDSEIADDMQLLDAAGSLVEQSNGLVVYDASTDIVSLGHSTVKTFLTSTSTLEKHRLSDFDIGTELANHQHMLRTCLTYLSFSEFNSGFGSVTSTTFERHPAINYVTQYWPHHLKDVSLEDWERISSFFEIRRSRGSGNHGAWIDVLNMIFDAEVPLQVTLTTHPISYAASFGYTPLVKAILRREKDTDLEAPPEGRRGSTVLQMACFRFREYIAHLLVEAGADPFSLDGSSPPSSSVTWAQLNDWHDLLQVIEEKHGKRDDIQDKGAGINETPNHADPILRTASKQWPQIFNFLPIYQISLTDLLKYFETRFGPVLYPDFTQFEPDFHRDFLQPQILPVRITNTIAAAITTSSSHRMMAEPSPRTLDRVRARGSVSTVGWDPLNVQDSVLDQLFSYIQSNTPESIDDIARLLRDNPGIANSLSDTSKFPPDVSPQKLLEQDKYGYLLTQDVLRHRQGGQQVKAGATMPQRPLHIACLCGNADAVELLLEQPEVELNATNGAGETPLGVACRAAQLSIAEILLQKSGKLSGSERRIHVDQTDHYRHTPVKFLARRGIDPLWHEHPGRDELVHLVRSMLEASKYDRTTPPVKFKKSCMIAASRSSSLWLLKLMLELAPELIDEPFADGWTPLQAAIARGDGSAVHVLVRQGANTKDGPDGWNARAFASKNREDSIARMIGSHEETEPPDYLNGFISSNADRLFGLIPSDTEESSFCDLPVDKLVRKLKKPEMEALHKSNQVIWCHLPANDWHWIEGIYDDEYTRSNLYNIFRVASSRQSSCGGHFPNSRTVDSNMRRKTPPSGSINSFTMLPTIDIDILDGYRRDVVTNTNSTGLCDKNVLELYDGNRPGLQPPRTLDHYHQLDLDEATLSHLDGDQVFSRYLKNTGNGHKFQNEPLGVVRQAQPTSKTEKTASQPPPSRPRHDSHQEPEKHTDLEAQRTRTTQSSVQESPATDAEILSNVDYSQEILVVSQFWLFKANNVLVTSYPRRRGGGSGHQGSELEHQLRGQPGRQQSELSLELRDIFSNFEDADDIYHEMVKKTMQYKPSIMIHDDMNTYLDIFSNEVLRITHAIDKCYSSFREGLGKSEKSFENLTEDATTCLMGINDVQHEIGIIRQILKHRSQAWKELHDNPPKARRGSQTSESAFRRPCCSWGIEACDPSSISDFSYGDIDRIEKDAVRVQKKVYDLQTLLQGQVGTEHAIRASEHSRFLAIFTILTVFFSPLSFVMSLLALRVQDFTPDAWNMGQVSAACVIGVAATFVMCAFIFYWMRYDKIQKLLKTDDWGKLIVEQMQKLKSRKDTKKKD